MCTGFVGTLIAVFVGSVGTGIGAFAGSVTVLLFTAAAAAAADAIIGTGIRVVAVYVDRYVYRVQSSTVACYCCCCWWCRFEFFVFVFVK